MIYVNGMWIKENCFSCEHLDYVDDTSYETLDGGNVCNKREDVNESKQRKHENQLQDNEYLKRYKSCCDIKDEWKK